MIKSVEPHGDFGAIEIIDCLRTYCDFLTLDFERQREPCSAITDIVLVNCSESFETPSVDATSSEDIALMSVMLRSVASLCANSSETPSSISRFFVALFTTILKPRSDPAIEAGRPVRRA